MLTFYIIILIVYVTCFYLKKKMTLAAVCEITCRIVFRKVPKMRILVKVIYEGSGIQKKAVKDRGRAEEGPQ